MGKSKLEDLILKYQRSGAHDKANWLSTIERRIPPSFKGRIIKNDKTVLRELILPNWVTWDLLRDWSLEDEDQAKCTICSDIKAEFINYKNATICNDCLSEVKKISSNNTQ